MDDPAYMLAPDDGYKIDDLVPFHFTKGFIALSFFVSLLGNFLTVRSPPAMQPRSSHATTLDYWHVY